MSYFRHVLHDQTYDNRLYILSQLDLFRVSGQLRRQEWFYLLQNLLQSPELSGDQHGFSAWFFSFIDLVSINNANVWEQDEARLFHFCLLH